MIPLHTRSRCKGAQLLIRAYGIRAAFVLWRARRKAGLSLGSAAKAVRIRSAQLRRFELGRESPPCRLIYALLNLYEADEAAIFFFCTIPRPMESLGQWARRQFQRLIYRKDPYPSTDWLKLI